MTVYTFKNKEELHQLCEEIHGKFFNLNPPYKNQFRLKFIYNRLNTIYFKK